MSPPLKGGNSSARKLDDDDDPDYANKSVKVDDNNPISSRLRGSKRTVDEEVSAMIDRGEKLAMYKRRKWPRCIINQCNKPLGDLGDWQKHIKAHHQDSIVSKDVYKCTIGECNYTFKMIDPRKAWLKHVKPPHRVELAKARPSPRLSSENKLNRRAKRLSRPKIPQPPKVAVYGDGGRENLIPLDGTFMKRLVERLSREGNVQETQEAGVVASHPRRRLVKGLYLSRPAAQDEELEEVKEQHEKYGVSIEDEIMGGCEEGIHEGS